MGSFITEMTAAISYAGNSTFKPTVFKLWLHRLQAVVETCKVYGK